MTLTQGPLILLSPAKSLCSFDSKLSSALAAIKPSVPRFASQSRTLASALGKMSKVQIKQMMGLSDSLAALNHARFASFDEQPSRAAVCAFEGAAYKGLDAKSLSPTDLDYCQAHLRILCGLYGVLQPYDEIRPYRLEMSTKLECDGHANLYKFWGDTLTDSLAAEKPKWVLNVASQEYAKSVDLKALADKGLPVVTAVFPGPAIHAKTARVVRFCAENKVTSPDALRSFRGSTGTWNYVASESDDTTYVFKRGAASPAVKAVTGAKKKRAGADEDVEGVAAADAPPAPPSSRRRQ